METIKTKHEFRREGGEIFPNTIIPGSYEAVRVVIEQESSL
jgi:hypothetical protein